MWIQEPFLFQTTTLEEAQLLMNCHPLAAPSAATPSSPVTAVGSPVTPGGAAPAPATAVVYENNNLEYISAPAPPPPPPSLQLVSQGKIWTLCVWPRRLSLGIN